MNNTLIVMGKTRIIYDKKQLELLNETLSIAIEMVDQTIIDKKIKDNGSCVLGAGIYIYYRAKGKRIPIRMLIISAPFQGNISIQESLEPSLKYLKKQGIDCWYSDGNMD